MTEALAYTERRTRAAIHAIPDGVYAAEDWIDTDGVSADPVPIRCTLTVAGDEITVDLRGSSPLVAGPINYPAAGSHSAVYFALKFFLDPDAPPNAGMYRPITVILPESGVVNARWPAPVFNGNLSTSERIADVVWQALGQAIPERMVGMTYGDCNSFSVSAHDPETGVPYLADDLPPGGWGGTPFGDGMNATYSRHGNCMDLTVEMTELIYPIRFERRELLPDSGRPGAHRGGLGMRQTFAPIDHDAVCGIESSRSRIGPPDVQGGKPGAPGARCAITAAATRRCWAAGPPPANGASARFLTARSPAALRSPMSRRAAAVGASRSRATPRWSWPTSGTATSAWWARGATMASSSPFATVFRSWMSRPRERRGLPESADWRRLA